MLKRVIAAGLILLLLVNILVIPVNADSSFDVKVNISNQTPVIGETITVELEVTGNPGIGGYQARIGYDSSKLEYVDSDRGTASIAPTSFIQNIYNTAVNGFYADGTNSMETGVIAWARFKVIGTGNSGLNVTIEAERIVTPTPFTTESVATNVTPHSVTIGSATAVTIGSVSGRNGETVTVPVSISGNTGFLSYYFRVQFDNTKLEYVGAAHTPSFPVQVTASVGASPNVLNIYGINAGTSLLTSQGAMLNLSFKIKEAATGSAVISLHNNSYLMKDTNPSNALEFSKVSGTVNITAADTPNYMLNLTAAAGGTVRINSGSYGLTASGSFTQGATPTISARANTGYKFDGWTIESGSAVLSNVNNATATLTMPASAVSVKANFSPTGGGLPDVPNTPSGGSGSASPTATVGQQRVPDAPTKLSVRVGDGLAALTWSRPESDGNAEIIKYEVSIDGGKSWIDAQNTDSHRFTGLINGTRYEFAVRAVNAKGGGRPITRVATPQKHLIRVARHEPGTEVKALLGNNPLFVSGREVDFPAFKIEHENYIKLRDFASILSGSVKQFEISYDEPSRSVYITTNRAYTPIGGEMLPPALDAKAIATAQTVYFDGARVTAAVYNITPGYNYFRLRDLAILLDFDVYYDVEAETVTLDFNNSYAQ